MSTALLSPKLLTHDGMKSILPVCGAIDSLANKKSGKPDDLPLGGEDEIRTRGRITPTTV